MKLLRRTSCALKDFNDLLLHTAMQNVVAKRDRKWKYCSVLSRKINIPANKMLADYRQTDSRFDQKMSAG